MPKLSIITVNYNQAEGLKKTLESVYNQSFRDIEHLIIDGGSTDASKEVIASFASSLSYWVSEPDRGIYHAMNKGISKAKGDYCLFLNSGDYLYSQNVLHKAFELGRTEDLLYGEIATLNNDNKESILKLPITLDNYYIFHGNIWHPSSFIKRKLFIDIGFYNESYKIAADYDFFVKLIKAGISSYYLPFPITYFEGNGISSKIENTDFIRNERNLVHKTNFSVLENAFFENRKKFKSIRFAKWISDKPKLNSIFNSLLSIYSKIR